MVMQMCRIESTLFSVCTQRKQSNSFVSLKRLITRINSLIMLKVLGWVAKVCGHTMETTLARLFWRFRMHLDFYTPPLYIYDPWKFQIHKDPLQYQA